MITDNEEQAEVLETENEQREYLLQDGVLRVPCSRYGRDTYVCAEIAIIAERITARETNAVTTKRTLNHVMGCVVNDNDGLLDLVFQHGTKAEIIALDRAVNQGDPVVAPNPDDHIENLEPLEFSPKI